MFTHAFADEFVKIAATMAALRTGAARVKGIHTPAPGSVIEQAGALAIPTRAMMKQKHHGTLKKMLRLQSKFMPKEWFKAYKREAKGIMKEPTGPGRIYIAPNVGETFAPTATARTQRAFRKVFTPLHESAERQAAPVYGSLHGSPAALMKDVNLLQTVTGPGSRSMVKSVRRLRDPEIEALQGQMQRTFKDPRVQQFFQPGAKIPKAMRKAFLREPQRFGPGKVQEIMGKQHQAMQADILEYAKRQGINV
jgi:hypothetical protein